MEEIVVRIKKEHIREYMQEALNCYNAKSYRGCVIMSTIAAMHDLYEKIDGLASSVQEARELITEIEKRKSTEDTYERHMVEKAGSITILTSAERTKILSYLDIRNQCAHPNEHISTAEEARAVFTGYIDTIISQPALLGPSYTKTFVSRLESNNFFPKYDRDVVIDTVKNELKKLHNKTRKPLAKKLISIIETEEVNSVKWNNAKHFIAGMLVLITDEDQLRNICMEFSNLIERDNFFDSMLFITKMAPKTVNLLESIDRKRYMANLIKSVNTESSTEGNEVVQLVLKEGALQENEISEIVEKYKTGIQGSVQKAAFGTLRSSVDNLNKWSNIVKHLNISILDEIYFENLLELIRDSDYNIVNDALEMLEQLDGSFIKRMNAKYHTDVVIQIVRKANGPGRGSDTANKILESKFERISFLVDYFLEYATQNYEQLSYVLIQQHYDIEHLLMIIDITNNHDFLKKVVQLIIASYDDDELHNGHILGQINWFIAHEYSREIWTNLSADIAPYIRRQ
ncbi:hypothetical protein [Bacillus pseudomycoides]|uniref:hypothetical protein n=1 Tax=Bacillus pseudomycoides TaxID=64104 RepID=UPI001145BE07|nr:hypothetical protein [Bacillus pseudomycoides]MCR8861110.1 hypothetical protein [Bacillus pseudomycoides]